MNGFLSRINIDDLHFKIKYSKTEKSVFWEFGQSWIAFSYRERSVFDMKENVIIPFIINGVVLNKHEVVNNHALSSFDSLFTPNLDITYFLDLFRGNFNGLWLNDISKELFIFNDQVSSKPIYYFLQDNILFWGSNFQEVAALVKKQKHTLTLNTLSCYSILTYGYMIDDNTYFKEIVKMPPGSYIKITSHQIKVLRYCAFTNLTYNKMNKTEFIDLLESNFTKAIAQEFDFDVQNNKKHAVTLSGGLDSRLVLFKAHEMGYNNITNFTFSQSYYDDEKIARQISDYFRDELFLYTLDNGVYLTDIESPISKNGGLVLYSGSAHLNRLLELVNWEHHGLLHTGMLGDAVLGTYLSGTEHKNSNGMIGMYSDRFEKKIKQDVSKYSNNYPNDEMFLFYNRGLNGILNGFTTAHHFIEPVSPFLHKDFLDVCFSINPDIKYKRKLYIDWILSKHRDMNKFKWEATGTKLNSSKFTRFFVRGIRKLTNKKSMNPFDLWFRKNTELNNRINSVFNDNIEALALNPELKNDMRVLFAKGNFIEKSQVITLITSLSTYASN